MDEVAFGQQIWETVFPYIETFIAGVFAVATPLAAKYFIGWLKSKFHSATFRCALEKAEKMAGMGVQVANQTYADEKRKASKDGKLTPEEAKEAFGIASKAAFDSLGPKWFKEMQGCMGLGADEVKAFVGRLIESRVQQGKNGAGNGAETPFKVPSLSGS